MQYLWLALLLPQLSYQIPLAVSDTSLQARSEGVHSFSLTRVAKRASSSNGVTTGKVRDNSARSKYTFPLSVEGKTYNLEIDTSSADTWIAGKDFKCYKAYDNKTASYQVEEAQKVCKYDAKYATGKGFSLQPNLHFQDCYEKDIDLNHDRCVRGRLGSASVKIGDITVNQLIGVSNFSSYIASGEKQSGILGLGQSGLTNAFDNSGAAVMYPPIMQTIFNANLSTPLKAKQFSLALSRDHGKKEHGGRFTIGGTPPLNDKAVNVSSTTASSAPWVQTSSGFYAIAIDGFVAGSSRTDSNTTVMIDTGADIIQVPPATQKAMNALWSPAIGGDNVVSCKAKLTQPIGIAIGGTTYYMLAEDLMVKGDDKKCRSLIRISDDKVGYRIGDPFMRNVLAVFDWGNQAMEFYPRQYYKA